MKKLFYIATALLAIACTRQAPDVDMAGLLAEMTDRSSAYTFPSIEYRQMQVSSYDRRTVSPDEPGWWANDDGGGYERLDTIAGRLEKVMMDVTGPGAVTRIWMTTKEKFGTMRIYLDGARKPQVVIPAYDMKRFPLEVPGCLSLTHTHYAEAMDGVGGNSFFLPIPFAKGCKITFEEPDITVKIPRYYHIGYRMYPEGTVVKTFSLAEAKKLLPQAQAAAEALANPADAEGTQNSVVDNLAPGKELTLALAADDSKIDELQIKVSRFPEDGYGHAMRSLILKASFDGVAMVEAPLSDFCGGGFGAPATEGWWLSSDGAGNVVCRFPMPFRHEAKVVLVNKGGKTVNAVLQAVTSLCDWGDNTLYFHTGWKQEDGIPVSPDYDSDDNLDWNFATIRGRGKYVGDLLTLNNHAIDWYGEGDEKIFVDGETFPSHMGTGTEDYFNCSWAPVVPFLTPYGGAPRADSPTSHGYNTFLRTRVLDDIPFKESFRFDLEMLSWHHGTVDYAATAFWYGDIDATYCNVDDIHLQ